MRHAALAAALTLAACGALAAQVPAAPNVLSSQEQAEGFRLLFDGHSTRQWRGFRRGTLPDGWRIEDGTLTLASRGAGDIVTAEQFENFELRLEWRVEPGGNSGIFFRASEDFETIYTSAPEMQVLDDERHRDGGSPLTSAGANYGLHPAPRGVVRPAGQWNEARLIVNGDRVEHWLNGVRLLEYTLWSDEWRRLVAASKFAQWPQYGMARRGHIGLQDHGDRVWYRSIRVRVLP